MRLIQLYTLIPLSLLCNSSTIVHVHAQSSQGNILTDEVDTFINQLLVDWTSPGGAAVAVVKLNGQGMWNVETKGYGTATFNGTKVNENTRFSIGSNSKLFDILATGLLVSNATLSPRLSWTSKIASIIPSWSLEDPIATRQATIIDLMSHRTGMPRHDYSYKWSDDIPGIIKKLKFLKPSAEFRDVWQYDNMMYMVLSYLPTAVLPSKTPFARYVKEHIFDPLGMTSTTYSYDVANASGQLADGMTKQGNFSGNIFANGTVRALPFWDQHGGEDGDFQSGPGGVISTATDMAIWLQTLLLNGVKPGTNISVIPASAIARVANGISVESGRAPFPELSPTVYGGGQILSTYRGHELIEHGGDVQGFHSQISRFPFDNLGVAILTNDNLYGPAIREIIKGRILDEAFGLEPVDWSSRYKALLSAPSPPSTPRPAKVSLPAVNFTALAGIYNNDGYGRFELCLIAPKNPLASRSCQALSSNISTILPGTINPMIPTFVGEWNSPAASHVKITHFNGNLFNVTAFTVYPTGNPSEPFWIPVENDNVFGGTNAELLVDKGHIGMGIRGIWGAGGGIPSPQGNTARERAEAWFDKL